MPQVTETTQPRGYGRQWEETVPGHRALCLAKDCDFILRDMGSHAEVLMGRVLTRHFQTGLLC